MAVKTKPKPKPAAAKTEVKPKPAAKKAPAAKTAPKTRPATKPKPKPKATAAKTKTAPAARKTATKPKPAPKTKAAAKPAAEAVVRETDVFGYTVGTDSSILVAALVEGGASRLDVTEQASAVIAKTNGLETRAGNKKNISSLISALMKELDAKGYTVESSFRIVPPADVADALKKEQAAAKRRATRAASAKK